MKIINNCCDTCLHKKVCKNISSSEALAEIIKNTIVDKNDKLNFTIKIVCDDYFGNVVTEGKDNDTSRLDITTPPDLFTPDVFTPHTYKLNKSDASCEGCPTYEMLKNLDGPYLGDLPCQWCTKNAHKFTGGPTTTNLCSNNKTTIKVTDYAGKCNSDSSNSAENVAVEELK